MLLLDQLGRMVVMLQELTLCMGQQHQPHSPDSAFAGAPVQEQVAHTLSALDVCTTVLNGELSFHMCTSECCWCTDVSPRLWAHFYRYKQRIVAVRCASQMV